MDRPRFVRAGAALALAIAVSGCVGLGPQRLGIERSDYANRLRETGKEQLLLNLVAMRYGDAPLFLDVTSVISQYTREGSLHADVPISPPPNDTNGVIGGSVLLRETPTITYAPLSGDRFARSLLAPIPPAALLAMIEAGWSAGDLFRLTVRSVNGVRNLARSPLFVAGSDPAFIEITTALDRLQRSGGLVLHVERGEHNSFTATASFSRTPSDEDRADLAFLRRALQLPGDGSDLSVIFAAGRTQPKQLALGSRSMFEIFSEMAQGVELPAHERAGRATLGETADQDALPLVRIHSGEQRPADAHVAVHYRGSWFWIDGSDAASKRMFLIAQILLSLNDTSSAAAPLLTIPAG